MWNSNVVVNWDFDSGDSVGATTTESKNKYAAIAKKHPSNILALNHETERTSVCKDESIIYANDKFPV